MSTHVTLTGTSFTYETGTMGYYTTHEFVVMKKNISLSKSTAKGKTSFDVLIKDHRSDATRILKITQKEFNRLQKILADDNGQNIDEQEIETLTKTIESLQQEIEVLKENTNIVADTSIGQLEVN